MLILGWLLCGVFLFLLQRRVNSRLISDITPPNNNLRDIALLILSCQSWLLCMAFINMNILNKFHPLIHTWSNLIHQLVSSKRILEHLHTSNLPSRRLILDFLYLRELFPSSIGPAPRIEGSSPSPGDKINQKLTNPEAVLVLWREYTVPQT